MTLPTGAPDEHKNEHQLFGIDLAGDATPIAYTITEDGRIYVRDIQVGKAPKEVIEAIDRAIIHGFHIGGRATGRTARAETVKELYERHLVDMETFERERLGNWADEDPRTCEHPNRRSFRETTGSCVKCLDCGALISRTITDTNPRWQYHRGATITDPHGLSNVKTRTIQEARADNDD